MGQTVSVKVVGFSQAERHAINTLFNLSGDRPVSYVWWTDQSTLLPRLVLIDGECASAELSLAWATLAPNASVIYVGTEAVARAGRTFQRPLRWPDIVQAMDQLMAAPSLQSGVKPTGKVSLIVDACKEDRFYLRARLALAGHTDVDDAENADEALALARKRYYDLLIVSLDVPDMSGWELVRQLVALEPAMGPLLVISRDKSWQMLEYADTAGCRGVLEKPFDPLQLQTLLQQL